MKPRLYIPSARLIPAELRTDFGLIPSGMIPLGARPALHYIIEAYADRCTDAVVLIHEGGAMVTDWLGSRAGNRARAFDVGLTNSLGETLLKGLRAAPPEGAPIIVNFGDTFVGDPLPEGDAICYQTQAEVDRWTIFETSPDGRFSFIEDKEAAKEGNGGRRVFVGVFQFADSDLFGYELDAALAAPERGLDPFYTALRKYFDRRPGNSAAFLDVADWRDFGHLDTYYTTKSRFSFGARSFNSVEVDLRRGVILKSSQDEKLRNEIRWYLSLPRHLQYLAPRVFSHGTEPGETFVEMEFYGYPTLNDVYIFGEWESGVWTRVFNALGLALDGMQEVKSLSSPASARVDALRAMYFTKTRDRIRAALEDPRPVFHAREVTVNGVHCPGLEWVESNLDSLLEASDLLNDVTFTVIHGDFCLSNLLFDRRNGILRVIDPRGKFGSFEIFGDPDYDLAKLSHSFLGDYDFFVNGLFRLDTGDSSIRYSPILRPHHLRAKAKFSRWMEARYGPRLDRVRLIQSLLFLSMLPLHRDRPDAQICFLAQGLTDLAAASRRLAVGA